MQDHLSLDEMHLWHAWKMMGETVRARIVQEIMTITGLSEPDYGVLSRLDELGDGQLRQQALAESMHWSKSRLSHILSHKQAKPTFRAFQKLVQNTLQENRILPI